VGLEWTQASSVLVRPDTPVQVYLTMTLPNDCAPDTISTFKLTATSQNDSRRLHEIEIDISASMISNASVEVTDTQSTDDWIVNAGDTKSISFTITNHAARQDIFEMSVQSSGAMLWVVEQPTRPDAVINSGASTTFTIKVTAPANAQAGDNGPSIIPIITSTRSGMTFMGAEFKDLEVESIEDIIIRLVDSPLKLTPGIGNKIEIEIENDGNGPTQVVIDLPNLPDSWQWWMRLSDQNHTGPIDLSASYDLQDIKIVEVWILISMDESAGIMHSIEITAMSNSMGTDVNPLDNLIEINAIIADVLPEDINETQDTDGDGFGDESDAFPAQITQWADYDGDGFGDNYANSSWNAGFTMPGEYIPFAFRQDACPLLAGTSYLGTTPHNEGIVIYGCPDTDGDGYADIIDFVSDKPEQVSEKEDGYLGIDLDLIGIALSLIIPFIAIVLGWYYSTRKRRSLESLIEVMKTMGNPLELTTWFDSISTDAILNGDINHAQLELLRSHYRRHHDTLTSIHNTTESLLPKDR